MYTVDALLEFHERTHRSLKMLLAHCGQLSAEELNRELTGFGYPTVQIQLHHIIGAEKYWIGVLKGRIDVGDKESDCPTVELLETYRQQVFSASAEYLRTASKDELNTPRMMMTWGNKEKMTDTSTRLYPSTGAYLPTSRPNCGNVPAHGKTGPGWFGLSYNIIGCVASLG